MEKWFVEKIVVIEKRVGTLQLDITSQSKGMVDLRRENVNLPKQITDYVRPVLPPCKCHFAATRESPISKVSSDGFLP